MDTAERRRFIKATTLRTLACAFAFVLVGAASQRADAAFSCSNPDNICRGNPCVTGPIEVISPCEIDFGARTLIINGTLSVPNGGIVKLKAARIDVRRAIIGRHAKPYSGFGGNVELEATGGIDVLWRIDVSGRLTPGSIVLKAGGDIRLFAPVRARASGTNPTAPGGAVTLIAGGKIEAVGRARIRVEGDAHTAGGEVSLSGAKGVVLHNRIDADGATGGSVYISANNGDISVAQKVTANGSEDGGGAISMVSAGGRVTLLEQVEVEGVTGGGVLALFANGDVTTFGALRAGGGAHPAPGGAVLIASNQNVLNYETIYADGGSGGQISLLSSFGTVRTAAPLLADGSLTIGGGVVLTGGDGVEIGSSVDADGATEGGAIAVEGFAVTLTNRGDLFARGDVGGTISLRGSSVTVEPGAKVLVDGDVPGGTIRLNATDGDLKLGGEFHARGQTGGRIEGEASQAVVANGDFETDGGCIALSGSSVDITGGVFDQPVVDMCAP